MAKVLLIVVLILVLVPATAVCLNRLGWSIYRDVIQEQHKIDQAHPENGPTRH
jgi:hypothetical protein